MCLACYEKHTGGVDPAVTDEMVRTKELVEAVYDIPGCGAGGPLHVIVDDMNIEDRFFGDGEGPIFRGYEDMGEEGRQLCWDAFNALKGLTAPERAWVTYSPCI